MPQDYHLFLRREALEFLKTIPRKDRDGLWKLLDFLEVNPYTEGDFRQKDHTDRYLEGVILGKYAIIFWTDHAVSEVKVTEIRFADR